MNKQELDTLEVCAKYIGWLIAGGIVVVNYIKNYYKNKQSERDNRLDLEKQITQREETKAKETSVGAAKIIELFDKYRQHEEHLNELEDNDKRQDVDILGLKSENKEMFKLVLELIRKP